jgi:hypothetical protein
MALMCMKAHRIYGICCRLRTTRTRRVVRIVLDRIRSRCPSDFERLQSLVREIIPLSRSQIRDGTRGQWIEEQGSADDPSTWGYGYFASPGKMLLAEDFETPEDAIATVAHEFGHACTSFDDLERRGAHISDEWTSELAADWYACKKWGFACEINQTEKGVIPTITVRSSPAILWSAQTAAIELHETSAFVT